MPRLLYSDLVSVLQMSHLGELDQGWNLSLRALCPDDAPRAVRFLSGAVMACGGCVLSRRFAAQPGIQRPGVVMPTVAPQHDVGANAVLPICCPQR